MPNKMQQDILKLTPMLKIQTGNFDCEEFLLTNNEFFSIYTGDKKNELRCLTIQFLHTQYSFKKEGKSEYLKERNHNSFSLTLP